MPGAAARAWCRRPSTLRPGQGAVTPIGRSLRPGRRCSPRYERLAPGVASCGLGSLLGTAATSSSVVVVEDIQNRASSQVAGCLAVGRTKINMEQQILDKHDGPAG
ncbi:hypothetical protein C2845_PM09G11930 [Panicum miliaceum]|uniref:Uncharacterized protein n=1 Tax=Panicum miliaceum TaxID=4540 RepID=A0A3L6RWD2_PANMI|nr:hypothetical protein C2845_PM09G11930 [Panicum miliaceum]